MEDPQITKSLRQKEKAYLSIEGLMDNAYQYP
jgi:hypothetical protein